MILGRGRIFGAKKGRLMTYAIAALIIRIINIMTNYYMFLFAIKSKCIIASDNFHF